MNKKVTLIVLLILLLSCIYTVKASSSSDKTKLEKQTTKALERIRESYNATADFMIVVVLFTIIMSVLYLVLKFGGYVSEEEESYFVDKTDVTFEPGKLKVRDAKKILQIRFAKGEISSEEYTERMARL